MKKLLVVLLALAVLGIFAFADDMPAAAAPVVTIGDWGRQVLSFGNQDNNNGYYGELGASWGNNPRIVGLNITAHNDNAGFSITPDADNGSFGLTDQNKAWVSPMPGLTMEMGINLETDTWRGASDFGSDDWVRFGGNTVGGNSSTFARLGEDGAYESDLNYNKDGIGAWVLFANPIASPATDPLGQSIQAGAAYAIPGIGTIKAQYYGANVPGSSLIGNEAGAFINAAFNLSAVKGLYEEIGVYYPTSDVGYTFGIADDISYAMAPLTIHARVQYVSYDSLSYAGSGTGLAGGVGADFDLGNGIGAGADVQYQNAQMMQSDKNGNTALTGVAVHIQKGFSNGYIGIGFEYSTVGWDGVYNTYNGGATPAGSYNNGTNQYSHWCVPIVISEWL